MSIFSFKRKSTAVFIVEDISLDGTLMNVSDDTFTFIVKKNIKDPDSSAVMSGELNAVDYGLESKVFKVLTEEETDIEPYTYPVTVKWVTSTGRTYYINGYMKCEDIAFN